MVSFTYQPALRSALPCIDGTVDYREQRAFFQRIDAILFTSGLEQDFINLALTDRKIDTAATRAKCLETFARYSVLALRSHPDESHRAHPQTWIEEPDATRTARILERNEHPLHEDGRQGPDC